LSDDPHGFTCGTPHKSKTSGSGEIPEIGLTVGLSGKIAFAAFVGTPFDPKEAYAWREVHEDTEMVPFPKIPSINELLSTYASHQRQRNQSGSILQKV
jgi:hypothetical protein